MTKGAVVGTGPFGEMRWNLRSRSRVACGSTPLRACVLPYSPTPASRSLLNGCSHPRSLMARLRLYYRIGNCPGLISGLCSRLTEQHPLKHAPSLSSFRRRCMAQAFSHYRHLVLATPCGGTTGSVNRSHCVIPARDGLIDSRPGADKRIRIVSVTGKACKLIENAEPEWHKAQEALMEIV